MILGKLNEASKDNRALFSVVVLLLPNLKHRRRQWHPTPVLLPGKSHEQRSLVGCSPWGRTESDTTEATQQQQGYNVQPDKYNEHCCMLHMKVNRVNPKYLTLHKGSTFFSTSLILYLYKMMCAH